MKRDFHFIPVYYTVSYTHLDVYKRQEQDVLFNYNSSKAMLNELEKQMDSNIKRVIHNVQLVDKINQASDLTGKITQMETISTSSEDSGRQLLEYKNKLLQTRRDLSEISNQYVAGQYTCLLYTSFLPNSS